MECGNITFVTYTLKVEGWGGSADKIVKKLILMHLLRQLSVF